MCAKVPLIYFFRHIYLQPTIATSMCVCVCVSYCVYTAVKATRNLCFSKFMMVYLNYDFRFETYIIKDVKTSDIKFTFIKADFLEIHHFK